MQQRVVLYTWMAMGHLLPMVELAKLLLRHGFAVTIAITDAFKNTKSADTIARLSSANSSISFDLLSPALLPSSANADVSLRMFDSIRSTNPALLAFLRTLPSVHALVIDFFCTGALDVARELGIPAYFYYTSSATDLAVFLHLPTIHDATTTSFRDMGNTLIHFPGLLHPIPASHAPEPMLDRRTDLYSELLYHFKRLPKADGILVNAFEWLEPNAVKAIKDGLCLPGQPMPPIYCIGPLVDGEKIGEQKHECLTWLDAQQKQSVVFLCFGSAGIFSAAQLKGMANGLESSGQRFLWVVRSPPNDGKNKALDALPEPNLEELLSEEFLERTKDRGMVVKSWAPQAEVLRHEAVGAFVTHCGWNSISEAIIAGVPMVCWPMYAEQRLNKVFVVEEMKIGVEMKGYDEELVTAEEMEAKVRLVMESDEGKELRKRLIMAKEQAAEAVKEGGSSWVAFTEFLMDVHKCGRN